MNCELLCKAPLRSFECPNSGLLRYPFSMFVLNRCLQHASSTRYVLLHGHIAYPKPQELQYEISSWPQRAIGVFAKLRNTFPAILSSRSLEPRPDLLALCSCVPHKHHSILGLQSPGGQGIIGISRCNLECMDVTIISHFLQRCPLARNAFYHGFRGNSLKTHCLGVLEGGSSVLCLLYGAIRFIVVSSQLDSNTL